MGALKHNIAANYFGQGWAAAMGLVFIPLYVRYLGAEAYGIIGLFAVVQSCLSILDMGMSPTLTREMARHSAGANSPQGIHDLLHSVELVCFSLAILIAGGMWLASGWLANGWLRVDKLPTHVVAQAISVMAIVVALRFVEGIYRGSLFGLQQQVWYNGASAILATIRHGGAVSIIVWLSPTVKAFFIWQAVVSVATNAVFAFKVHHALPRPPSPPHFSREAIVGIWKFAAGMAGVTVLTLLLTQVDKLLLSRMLSLEHFGYYTLAATVAGALYMVIGPVTGAVYPRLVELSTKNDEAALASIYHQASQLVTVLTAPAALLLGFFSKDVLFVWSGNPSLARNSGPIVAVLTLGSFLNGLMWLPYQCQLAHGWTSLTVKMNLVAVAALVPAILLVVPSQGATGAAWIWVILNAGYLLIAIYLMHQRLLRREKWRWYGADVLLPVSGATCVVTLAQWFQPPNSRDRWNWLFFFVITGTVAMLVSAALAGGLRTKLLSMVKWAAATTVK